ncbi:MAG: F0F1 ATP synthase subunit B' [Alphaproteobacteria bacterium]|nr:F0F1 ATP synthase subunit B' [Alphaproteobacteria bacterium]
MPQFDVTTFSSQIFWLVISFAIVFVVAWRYALPRLNELKEIRQKQVESDLERAAALKADADAALASYELELGEAGSRAQEELRRAAARAAAKAQRRMTELGGRLAADAAAAASRIAGARAQALGALDSVAQELASAATQRLGGDAPDGARVAAAVHGARQAGGG